MDASLPVASSPSQNKMSDIYQNSIFWVEIERISPNPFQPRKEFDEERLKSLAESIRMYGLLQPLTVTRKEETKEDGGIMVSYELIAGERRLRASKLAGLTQIPVIIRSGHDTDQMKLELAIIENLQREDLNPVDKAKAFAMLQKQFNFTHAEIGEKVGKSREYVTNTLRLLMLPDEILGYLAEGRIAEGHTRPLLMLKDKPEEQMVLAKEILLKKLTVRESEALARRSAQDRVTKRKYKVNPEILELERKLTEKLGTRVQIEQKEVGGKVVISFFSADDLSNLLNNMRLEEESSRITNSFNGNPDAPAEDLTKKVMRENENMNALNSAPQNKEQTYSATNEEKVVGAQEGVQSNFVGNESSVHNVEPSPNRPLPEDENGVKKFEQNFNDSIGSEQQNDFMKTDESRYQTTETFEDMNQESGVGVDEKNIEQSNESAHEKRGETASFEQVSASAENSQQTVPSESENIENDKKEDEDDDLYSIMNFSI